MNCIILFISGPEIVVILLVVLLLFGSKKIPEFARGIGKGMREFRKATDDIMAWNKQKAIGTPSQIRLFSENALGEFTSEWAQKEIYVTSEMRSEYAKFLGENAKTEAAALYEQSSKLWEGLLESSTVSEDLKKIADLEEKAWSLY